MGSEPSCKLLWDAAGPKSSKLLLPSAVSVPDKAHHLFHLSFNFKNGAKKKIHIAIPRPITKKMKRYKMLIKASNRKKKQKCTATIVTTTKLYDLLSRVVVKIQ